MQLYQTAIQKDRVPVSTFDTIMFHISGIIGVGLALFAIYSLDFGVPHLPNKNMYIIVNILFAILGLFGIYAIKKVRQDFRLTFLKCDKGQEDKVKMVSELVSENKWLLLKSDTNYYKYEDFIRWTKYPNYITIIFDEKGFYLNVLDSRWKPLDFGVSKRMTKKIIAQLKENL